MRLQLWSEGQLIADLTFGKVGRSRAIETLKSNYWYLIKTKPYEVYQIFESTMREYLIEKDMTEYMREKIARFVEESCAA